MRSLSSGAGLRIQYVMSSMEYMQRDCITDIGASNVRITRSTTVVFEKGIDTWISSEQRWSLSD